MAGGGRPALARRRQRVHLSGMQPADPPDPTEPSATAIRVKTLENGAFAYAIEGSPRGLPPVTRRDLDLAWADARAAALAGSWGVVRGFRFRRPDGSAIDLALADPDARCWAGAVDYRVGLHTSYGLSILLRLLALVDLLARAPWSRLLCKLTPGGARAGADLDARLLAAAASAELTDDARFDEPALRARVVPAGLTHTHPAPGLDPPGLAGASA
jgi:hypothetical protein